MGVWGPITHCTADKEDPIPSGRWGMRAPWHRWWPSRCVFHSWGPEEKSWLGGKVPDAVTIRARGEQRERKALKDYGGGCFSLCCNKAQEMDHGDNAECQQPLVAPRAAGRPLGKWLPTALHGKRRCRLGT